MTHQEFILTLAIIGELTLESVSITVNELVKLGASSGLGCFAPPGSFPVSDLVAGDLPILPVKGWGLPPKHDALRGEKLGQIKQKPAFTTCGTICSCKGDLVL